MFARREYVKNILFIGYFIYRPLHLTRGKCGFLAKPTTIDLTHNVKNHTYRTIVKKLFFEKRWMDSKSDHAHIVSLDIFSAHNTCILRVFDVDHFPKFKKFSIY